MFRVESDQQTGPLESDPTTPFVLERDPSYELLEQTKELDPAIQLRLQRIITSHTSGMSSVTSDELLGYNCDAIPYTDIDTMLRLHALSAPDGRVMVNNGHLNQLLAGHFLTLNPANPQEGDRIYTTYQSEMNPEGQIVFAPQPMVIAYVPVEELLECGKELDSLGYRVSKEPNGVIGRLLGPDTESEFGIPVTRSLLLCLAKQLRQDSVAQDLQILGMHESLAHPKSKDASDRYKHQLVLGHQRFHFSISIAHKIRQSATLYHAMERLMQEDPVMARKIGVIDEIRGFAATNLQFGDDENLAYITSMLDPELSDAVAYFCRGYTS